MFRSFIVVVIVVLCIFIFVSTSVGLLPLGESPIAVSTNNNSKDLFGGLGVLLLYCGIYFLCSFVGVCYR
jgi:uncharacterized membrane protein (DUF106 family)